MVVMRAEQRAGISDLCETNLVKGRDESRPAESLGCCPALPYARIVRRYPRPCTLVERLPNAYGGRLLLAVTLATAVKRVSEIGAIDDFHKALNGLA